jgi:hypothetical protein
VICRVRSFDEQNIMTQQNKSPITEGSAPFTLGPSGGRQFALPTRSRGTVKLGAADSGGTISASNSP